MKKNWHIFVFCWITLSISPLYSQQNIILNFKPFPKLQTNTHKNLSIIDKPEKTPYILAKHQLGSTSGILAVLNGQASFTTTDGLINFKRESIENSLNILITNSISPIIFHGNTVYKWLISDPTKSQLFNAMRIQDPTTQSYSWTIKQIDIPTDQMLPPNTIVLFGDPKNIMIPVGSYVTHEAPHLVLPNFYVKSQFSTPGAYLKYLKHSRLYRQVKKMYKDAQESVSSLIKG